MNDVRKIWRFVCSRGIHTGAPPIVNTNHTQSPRKCVDSWRLRVHYFTNDFTTMIVCCISDTRRREDPCTELSYKRWLSFTMVATFTNGNRELLEKCHNKQKKINALKDSEIWRLMTNWFDCFLWRWHETKATGLDQSRLMTKTKFSFSTMRPDKF